MEFLYNKLILGGILLLAVALPAGEAATTDGDAFRELQVISDSELGAMRGGIDTSTGAMISFGIERAVFVDGILQAVTTLNLPQLNSMFNHPLSDQMKMNLSTFVRNGIGNVSSLNDLQSSIPNVVQNSLDQKTIDTYTIINATVPSISSFRNMNISSMMTELLARGMR